MRWGGHSHERTVRRLEELRDAALGLRPEASLFDAVATSPVENPPWSVHPYLGFDLEQTPAQIDEGIASQRDGVDAFDILLVGGSVAADHGYWGRPALFEALAADPRLAGQKLRLFNFARPAHKQPQQLASVEHLFALGFEPDAVISADGFNELAIAGANAERGMHPSYPADSQWLPLLSRSSEDSRSFELAAGVFARRDMLLGAIDSAASSVLLTSALAARPLLAEVNRRQKEYAAAVEHLTVHLGKSTGGKALRGPGFPRGEEDVLALSVHVWSESSRSLAGICAIRDIPCVIVLQPTLHDQGSKPLTAREVEKGDAAEVWKRAVRRGYPLVREAGAALRAEGVPFCDASGVFREHEEELYADVCHFGEAGHRIFAKEVARGLLEQI